MPLSYRQVKDLYDTLADANVVTKSLPDWSVEMNGLTGSDMYSEGLHDNLIKRASVGIDRGIESVPGLVSGSEAFGRGIGGLFGMPDAGAEIGSGLPRMAVNFLPMLAATALTGGAAPVIAGGAELLGGLGLAATSALSGADTYTKTGSPAAGLISAGTAAAFPTVANWGEQGVLKMLGGRQVAGTLARVGEDGMRTVAPEATSQLFAKNPLQAGGAFLGGQVAAFGASEGATMAQEALSGEPVHNPLSPESLLGLGLSQLPFAAMHGAGKLVSAKPTVNHADLLEAAIAETGRHMALKKAKEDLANKTDIEKVPAVAPVMASPETARKTAEILAGLRGEEAAILKKDEITSDDAEKLDSLSKQQDAITASIQPTSTSILGAEQEQSADKIQLIGKEVGKPRGASRTILVSDNPNNPEELRGRYINYSKGLYETAPQPHEEGSTFSVPRDWHTVLDEKTPQEIKEKRAASPTTSTPPEPDIDFLTALDRIDQQVTAAQTASEMQKAVGDLQRLKSHGDFPTTNDTKVREVVKRIAESGLVEDVSKAASRSEVAKAKRQVLNESQLADRLANSQAYLIDLEKRRHDVEQDPIANQIYQLRENFANRSGRYETSVSSGLFDEIASRWEKEGGTNIEELKGELEPTIKKGAGLKKVLSPASDEVQAKVKANVDAIPVKNMIVEYARNATRDQAAEDLYRDGPRAKESPLEFDKRQFVDWVDETGGFHEEDLPDMVMHFADRDGLEPSEVLPDLTDFFHSPHVQAWKAKLEEQVASNKEQRPRVQAPRNEDASHLPAGGPFVWSLAPYDPKTNRIGGKHTLPKDGTIMVGQLKAIGGRGKFLNDTEIDMMRAVDSAVGGGAFDGDKVNVKKLDQVLRENPVSVESHTYGMNPKASQAKLELDQLTHDWLETLPKEQQDAVNHLRVAGRPESNGTYNAGPELAKVDQDKLKSLIALDKQVKAEPPDTSPRATSYYKTISPFDTKKFPVIRVDVVLPTKLTDASKEYPSASARRKEAGNLWPADNLHENLPNTLGWAMGQIVPHNGEDIFFIGEQQSRWGQERQKAEKQFKSSGEDTGGQRPWTADDEVKSHPLLESQHILVLKAVIAHLEEINADRAKEGKAPITKVGISDGESGMMTEGHDKATRIQLFDKEGNSQGTADDRAQAERMVSKNEGWTYQDLGPSQAGGMRLHYDVTLPSAMRKLTGDKGEAADLGVHKNARDENKRWMTETPMGTRAFFSGESAARRDAEQLGPGAKVSQPEPEGSPVFKNPDGSPKTNATGLIFDVSKASANREAQGGFTLGDPTRAPRAESDLYIPSTPKTAVTTAELTGDGHTILAPLLKSDIPAHVQIASELIKNFPESLKMIQSKVVDGATASETMALEARRVGIEFEPSAVNTSPAQREMLVLHEVIHGLTIHELNRTDSPLRGQIKEIRIRAIRSLAPEMRDLFRKANESNWIQRNAEDPTINTWNSLAPTPEGRQILYALMNEHEFTAQAFSSGAFREYLKAVPGQATGWKSFVNAIRSAFGLSMKDNALSELIGASGQLMKHGEFMSTLQNYGERWFEDLGKGGDYAKLQTERGLGLVQEMSQPISRMEIVRSLGAGQDEVNSILTMAKQKLQEAFSNNPDESLHMGSVLMEQGYKSNIEGMNDLVENAIADGHDLADTLAILPSSATNFIFEKMRDHRDVLSMLKAATAEKNNGLVNIADPKLVRGMVTDALKPIQKILKQQQEHMEMARDLSKLAAVEPRVLVDQYIRAPKVIDDFIEDSKGTLGRVAHGLAWFLEPMGQKVRRLPEAGELTSKMFQLVSNARRMMTERLKPLAADMTNPNIDVVDAASLKANEKVVGNQKLLGAVDKWMQANQIEGKDSVQMLDDNHPKITKILQNLNPDERAQVRDMVVKAGKVTQYGHAQNLDMMTQEAAIFGAGIIGEDTGLKTRDNLALSDTLLRAVIDINDPMKQLLAQQQLQTVQQKLAAQPDTFLKLLEFAKNSAEKINAAKEIYDANPFWATAQRTERYLINGFKNGKPWLGQASSVKEGRDIAMKHGISLDRNNPFTDQWRGKEDEPFALPNMTVEMANRMKELEQNQVKMLLNRGLLEPDEVSEFLRTSAVGQVLKETAAAQKIGDITPPPRLLGKGSEDLPFLWNHIAHAQRESTYWSRRLLRAQVKTYLKDPELAGNDQLRSELATQFENLMQPDPQVAQKLTRLASTWFMGFNLASTLVNATQPFVTHVAELTAMSGKPLDSYLRIGRALKEATANRLGKKEWNTDEHDWFMKRAALRGERGLSMFDDAEQQEESVAMNFRRQMEKNKVQSIGQKLGNLAGTYSTVGMWTFRQVEQINATSALLAAFDYHREMGMTREEAEEKSYEFNHAVNFSGGRAQRSIGAFSGRGNFPRTVAMLGTSLQSYVLGTTFQIARYLQRGLFRPAGLQPHEVFASRKAAIQMLGTQFAAAGILGLPFASSAIALLNQMFPDLELPKKIRGGVNSFLSSDKDNGSVLTDIAMTGVPSMMGWDLQSRLSMGNTLPGVSEVNGFQPENLMGPVGNIAKNFIQGTQGWAKGDVGAGSKFLPPAIRKTLELANSALTDGGAIRDYQGRPLSSPTMGEQIGRALGFQPKRLSDQNEAAHIAKQSQDVASARESQDRQELAKEVLKGNFGTVRNQVIARAQSDKSYNSLDAVRSIARSAEEMKFPRDLRREGNLGTAGSRQGLLSSYSNVSQAGPSEEERLSFRMGIERSLGLLSQDRNEVAAAKLMDQLRMQNPNATRAELRAQAQSLLRRSAPGMLASPQE